jgi:hypothetical protein
MYARAACGTAVSTPTFSQSTATIDLILTLPYIPERKADRIKQLESLIVSSSLAGASFLAA